MSKRWQCYWIDIRPHQSKGKIGVGRFGITTTFLPVDGKMTDEIEKSVHFLSWFPIRIDPQLDYNMLKDAIASGPEARIKMHNKFYNID
jgi:hypothetical protein